MQAAEGIFLAIIFIDVFFIYNFIINLILLITTRLICLLRVKNIRLLIGALLASFFDVCVLVFELDSVAGTLISCGVSLALLYASFYQKNIKIFLKVCLVFFFSSMLYGGIMFFLMHFYRAAMHFGGGMFYVDLSVSAIVLVAIVVCLLLHFTKRFIEKKLIISANICSLEIGVGSSVIKTTALCDTGNFATEPFSGAPVIMIEEALLNDFDANINSYRAIPYKSAGGSGIMMAFAPDYIKIDNKKTEMLVYAAIFGEELSTGDEYHAILHPLLFGDVKNKELVGKEVKQ